MKLADLGTLLGGGERFVGTPRTPLGTGLLAVDIGRAFLMVSMSEVARDILRVISLCNTLTKKLPSTVYKYEVCMSVPYLESHVVQSFSILYYQASC